MLFNISFNNSKFKICLILYSKLYNIILIYYMIKYLNIQIFTFKYLLVIIRIVIHICLSIYSKIK